MEIEYHGKQRAVNIELAPVDLCEAFKKSRPTFPHKRHQLEKHKIEHKFEIKTLAVSADHLRSFVLLPSLCSGAAFLRSSTNSGHQ